MAAVAAPMAAAGLGMVPDSVFEIIPESNEGEMMQGIVSTRTMPRILCCLCGVDIDPNPASA